MVVAVLIAAADVGIENVIILGAMAVAAENCAILGNGLEDFDVLYRFLSSNVQFLPLLVLMFYIPARTTLKDATDSYLEGIPLLTGRLN